MATGDDDNDDNDSDGAAGDEVDDDGDDDDYGDFFLLNVRTRGTEYIVRVLPSGIPDPEFRRKLILPWNDLILTCLHSAEYPAFRKMRTGINRNTNRNAHPSRLSHCCPLPLPSSCHPSLCHPLPCHVSCCTAFPCCCRVARRCAARCRAAPHHRCAARRCAARRRLVPRRHCAARRRRCAACCPATPRRHRTTRCHAARCHHRATRCRRCAVAAKREKLIVELAVLASNSDSLIFDDPNELIVGTAILKTTAGTHPLTRPGAGGDLWGVRRGLSSLNIYNINSYS